MNSYAILDVGIEYKQLLINSSFTPNSFNLEYNAMVNSPSLLAISNIFEPEITNFTISVSGIIEIICLQTLLGVIISESDNLSNLFIATNALPILSKDSSFDNLLIFCIL